MPANLRRDQFRNATEDFVDARLPEGGMVTSAGGDFAMVATVVGRYGPSCGSYLDVQRADPNVFSVMGTDTRRLMLRQVWAARVLQAGRDLPDSDANEKWTFTVFPGEPLVEGLAESGTLLKGKIRFRLGKPDRGIGSARVAPAILVD
jgi:hypothetical protein